MILLGHVLETCMLLSFAVAWPFNILRAYRARTAVGTSPEFYVIIIAGYLFGIGSKVSKDEITFVLAFYILDIILVSTAIGMYLRNRRLDARRASRSDREGLETGYQDVHPHVL